VAASSARPKPTETPLRPQESRQLRAAATAGIATVSPQRLTIVTAPSPTGKASPRLRRSPGVAAAGLTGK
jgi:hypothetical protein